MASAAWRPRQATLDDIVPPEARESAEAFPTSTTGTLQEVVDRAEKQAIQRALSLCNNKIAHAADLLGVSRPTLYDLIEKYGLK